MSARKVRLRYRSGRTRAQIRNRGVPNMNRLITTVALAALGVGCASLSRATAEEPKTTETVNLSSSIADLDQQKAVMGTSVILSQREWERLAAAWGIKDPPKVDFSKEILLVGTWRGAGFKFLNDVKDGNLTTELVGDKEERPGFRYRAVTLRRDGITSFHGKKLPAE
ncbi:hypothetical protein C1280_07145 [Gemmata obscuriglobus]|uniref:Uncharacterized protein n=2 Tax=Gemmata obscuriglobus TaxID=114 RepID=A0A2Z3GXR7_9BACT|nr:hypothetical protein C1280_07145 [Gemmata obscuriglobus]